jgi:hypothetical protein
MPPLQRLGQPEDIASLVSFLASADAGWVNGQILRANRSFIRCRKEGKEDCSRYLQVREQLCLRRPFAAGYFSSHSV